VLFDRVGGGRHDTGVDLHDKIYVNVGKDNAKRHESPHMGESGGDGLDDIPHKACADHADVVMQSTHQSGPAEKHANDDYTERSNDVRAIDTDEQITNRAVLESSIIVAFGSDTHKDQADNASSELNCVHNHHSTSGVAHTDLIGKTTRCMC
jgi:hypothetical protein